MIDGFLLGIIGGIVCIKETESIHDKKTCQVDGGYFR